MNFVAVRRGDVSTWSRLNSASERLTFLDKVQLLKRSTFSMADWKIPVNYNYNPSYHAYAYGLMYQSGPEQNHPNLSGWAEAAYQTGANGGYYSTPQLPAQQESPPRSPENIDVNNVQYPGSGMLYFGDSHTQTGRLFMSNSRAEHEERTKEVERASSDTPTSDSEAHTSPGSNRSDGAPQAHPASWVRRDPDEETDGGSPRSADHVSSSMAAEPQSWGGVEGTPLPTPMATPKSKPKARAAFSDSQMTTLTHRFSLQRYLTPAEMKTLAGLTGLTYKQVKTWFQNRRMKLRRHQKDNSWVSERYTGPVYSSGPVANQFQPDPQTQDYCHQPMREVGLKRSPPLKLPYYTTPNPGAYPTRPSSPQLGSRPQGTCWPLPPSVTHYEYNPTGYSSGVACTSSEGGQPSLLQGAMGHGAGH